MDRTGTNEEFDVLRTVVQRLDGGGIPYMVTGSTAANLYSVPRMTRDIDMVIEVSLQDVVKLVDLFRKDFYIDSESIQDAIKREGMFNIIHDATVIKVDFIVRKESAYRRLEFRRRQQIHIRDIDVSVVRIEDLIVSKLLWAKDSLSQTQLTDVRNLLTSGSDVNIQYVEEWVQKLDLSDIYQGVIRE